VRGSNEASARTRSSPPSVSQMSPQYLRVSTPSSDRVVHAL